MDITADKLVQAGLATRAHAELVAGALDAACKKYGIDTGSRIASFLAQCSHESCGFAVTSENLNYTASQLHDMWPQHFNEGEAQAYAHQRERIANRAYAGHLGNGSEASGDGYRYRGRGFIQLTGKNNYLDFAQSVQMAELDPDLVSTPQYAALSAAWYWSSHNLNKLADTPGIVDETKAINGGTNGLADRERLYQKALAVFAV